MAFHQATDKFGNKKDYSAIGTSALRQMAANWTTNGRSLAEFPFTFNSRTTGVSGIITNSGNGFSLAAGYRYRVTALIQVYQANSNWTSYFLKFNGGGVDSIFMSHNGYQGAVSANNRQFMGMGIVDATATTTAILQNGDGESAGNWTFLNTSHLYAEVVGVI